MTLVGPTSSADPSSGSTTKHSAPDTSPTKAWVDAVAQARVNSPRKWVTAEPGDTITGIAESHHDTVASVEKANPQFFCPNLIPVGQKVYLPNSREHAKAIQWQVCGIPADR
jgi:hypothetical protein